MYKINNKLKRQISHLLESLGQLPSNYVFTLRDDYIHNIAELVQLMQVVEKYNSEASSILLSLNKIIEGEEHENEG
jgi:hypothetical protein